MSVYKDLGVSAVRTRVPNTQDFCPYPKSIGLLYTVFQLHVGRRRCGGKGMTLKFLIQRLTPFCMGRLVTLVVLSPLVTLFSASRRHCRSSTRPHPDTGKTSGRGWANSVQSRNNTRASLCRGVIFLVSVLNTKSSFG
jgi:hypothetical protein